MARECWTSWKTFRWSRHSLNYLLFTCAAPLDYWHVWEPALSVCLKTSLMSYLPCLIKVDWIDFEFEWVHAVCIYWVSSMILFSFTGQNSILTPVSGESRNEFAGWHVTWFVEWHNYAEYNDSNWKVRPFWRQSICKISHFFNVAGSSKISKIRKDSLISTLRAELSLLHGL